MRTSLRIGQGMVVIREVKSAGGSDGLELVVREFLPKMSSRCRQRVMEFIVRIVHLIDAEHLLETAFIKGTVVRDQGKPLDKWLNLLPNEGKDWSVLRVFRSQSAYLPAEPLVVLRLGMDEAVEGVHNLPSTYDHHAHAAYAAGLLVGRLEVYCREIFQGFKD